MQNVYYTVKLDSSFPYALVLSSPDARNAEKYEGYYSAKEIHQNMKENFGEGAVRLSGTAFQTELEKRLTHTSVMAELLRQNGDLLGQDLSSFFVYGSAMRPMNSMWASIEYAVYIQSNKAETGYHTYVAVPTQLDAETIERYELAFVSHP